MRVRCRRLWHRRQHGDRGERRGVWLALPVTLRWAWYGRARALSSLPSNPVAAEQCPDRGLQPQLHGGRPCAIQRCPRRLLARRLVPQRLHVLRQLPGFRENFHIFCVIVFSGSGVDSRPALSVSSFTQNGEV